MSRDGIDRGGRRPTLQDARRRMLGDFLSWLQQQQWATDQADPDRVLDEYMAYEEEKTIEVLEKVTMQKGSRE